jgi:hypothetical protein
MFSIIMTWIGAIFGIGLLVTMALGTFVVDFNDAFGDRFKKAPKAPETPASTVAPLS